MSEFMFKYGKKPAVYDPNLLKLAHFKVGPKPTVAPVGFGHISGINDWGMLDNDRIGDCVIASAEHQTMVLTGESGGIATFNNKTADHDYHAVTGWIDGDPDTDQGTDMSAMMKYRRKTGIIDANGKYHKVGAYLALEPGNWTQMLQALYAFDVVDLGIVVPQSAEDQFDAGEPWTVVPGSEDVGGHGIPAVALPQEDMVGIITWGKLQLMSKAFYQKYCDEAYVYVSEEALKNGKSPEGYDLTELNTIINSL